MKLMGNSEKISGFSYIRNQIRKESKKDTRSSFPPVNSTLFEAGFNTYDYGGFKNIHFEQVGGVFTAPGTASANTPRNKDKIFSV
jgi:hypothetical protein